MAAKASIVRRALARRLASVAAVATVVPTALATVLSALTLESPLIPLVFAFWVCGWLLVPPLLLASTFAGVERKLPGTGARIAGNELVLGEPPRRIAREQILGGICVHAVEGETVELTLRGGSVVRIAMSDETEALALLKDLGLSQGGRMVAHELAAPWPAMRTGLALFAAFIVAVVFGIGTAVVQTALRAHSPAVLVCSSGVAFMLAAWYALARRAPSQVVIGSDGVVLEGSHRRFIPYSRIASVVTTPDGVYLVTTGRVLGQRFLLTPERGPRSDALVAELEAAIARAERAQEIDSTRLERLDRGEMSVTEWRQALKRLATPETGYRRAPVERADLVEAASDGSADNARRLAAALALSHTGDQGAIERVRIAVDGLADREMRARMGEALDGTIEDAALEELVAIREQTQQR